MMEYGQEMLWIDKDYEAGTPVPHCYEFRSGNQAKSELFFSLLYISVNWLERFWVERTPKTQRLTGKEARTVNFIYRNAAALIQSIIVRNTSMLLKSEASLLEGGRFKATLRWMLLDHLTERIVKSFHHLCFLHRFYYESSHGDLAGIQRTMFENMINALYLITGDTQEFNSWFQYGMKEELKRNEALKKWAIHEKSKIRKLFERDYDPTVEKLKDSLDKTLALGSIEQRAIFCSKKTGFDEWAYYYDSIYRGLSSWSHSDSTRFFTSSRFEFVLEGEQGRAVFESTAMISRTYTLLELYAQSLCTLTKNEKDLESVELQGKILDVQIGDIMSKALERFTRRAGQAESNSKVLAEPSIK